MLLAIDTATATHGLCLDDGQQVLAERVWLSGRHHTRELAPAIALTLREIGGAVSDLRAVAVTSGPGSYSGLRIGMALAKGLALPRHLPLFGVPTLDVLVRGVPAAEMALLAVLAAGRGRLAAVWYKWRDRAWRADTTPEIMTWEEVLDRIEEPTLVAGELGQARPQLNKHALAQPASPAICLRRPSLLGEIARELWQQGGAQSAAQVVPVYLGELEAAK